MTVRHRREMARCAGFSTKSDSFATFPTVTLGHQKTFGDDFTGTALPESRRCFGAPWHWLRWRSLVVAAEVGRILANALLVNRRNLVAPTALPI